MPNAIGWEPGGACRRLSPRPRPGSGSVRHQSPSRSPASLQAISSAFKAGSSRCHCPCSKQAAPSSGHHKCHQSFERCLPAAPEQASTACPLTELRKNPGKGRGCGCPQNRSHQAGLENGHRPGRTPLQVEGQQAVEKETSSRRRAAPGFQNPARKARARAVPPAGRAQPIDWKPQLMALLGGDKRRRWCWCWRSCPFQGCFAVWAQCCRSRFPPLPTRRHPPGAARGDPPKPSSLSTSARGHSAGQCLADSRTHGAAHHRWECCGFKAGVLGQSSEAGARGPPQAQKCIRTQRHRETWGRNGGGSQTFIRDLLGNFSFGDYFSRLRRLPGPWELSTELFRPSIRPGGGEACSRERRRGAAIWA